MCWVLLCLKLTFASCEPCGLTDTHAPRNPNPKPPPPPLFPHPEEEQGERLKIFEVGWVCKGHTGISEGGAAPGGGLLLSSGMRLRPPSLPSGPT